MTFAEFTELEWLLGIPPPHLEIVIFADEVVKIKFLQLFLDGYLFIVVIGNRYLPRGGKENVLYITITGNVTMSR